MLDNQFAVKAKLDENVIAFEAHDEVFEAKSTEFENEPVASMYECMTLLKDGNDVFETQSVVLEVHVNVLDAHISVLDVLKIEFDNQGTSLFDIDADTLDAKVAVLLAHGKAVFEVQDADNNKLDANMKVFDAHDDAFDDHSATLEVQIEA